jgi:hypothetical protein
MERDFEQFDLGELLNRYVKESREFSIALESGESARKLNMKRLRVQAISIQINRKYKEINKDSDRRRSSGPPHE